MTWTRGILGVGVGAFTLGCTGLAPPSGGVVIQRVDFSQIDGVSCMVSTRNGVLVDLEKPYDLEACGPRSRDAYREERKNPQGFRSTCGVAWGGQCCEQSGGRLVGWAGHTDLNEKLVSPLCLFE